MVSITISVPEEIRETMRKLPEINWSALVRKSIIDEIKKRQLKNELLRKLSREGDFIDWSVDMGRRAKKGRLKRVNWNDSR